MKAVVVDGEIVTPSKVICIGRNYAEHIAELGNEIPEDMVVFIKPNSAISDQLIGYHQEPLHYEGEICLMVKDGKFCAVGFGLDLTKRALQLQLKKKGLPWERAKAFDGAAVLSEFVTFDCIDDQLALELSINGKLVQQGSVAQMLYKPQRILEQLSTFMTLEDGDIVMTGTPKGVGEIPSNSTFEAKVFSHNVLLLTHQWRTL